MTPRILVTGATGNVGSAVINGLISRGITPLVGTRTPAQYSGPGSPVAFSYADNAVQQRALDGVSSLFLITPPLVSDETEFGIGLIDAAKAAGVQHVVKLSAIGVENVPETSHRRVELHLEASGMTFTHLRPNFFAQNFDRYRTAGTDPVSIDLPAGDAPVSFVDTNDVGDVGAHVLVGGAAAGHAGQAYTLTGPSALSYAEVAAALSRAEARSYRYVDVSPDAARAGMLAAGMSDYAVGTMLSLYEISRAGWVAGVTPDIERLLGRPATSFADYAARPVTA